ncbi:MAG: hypothetical protein ACTHOB_14840 [Ginsengibacter sp.]
MGKRNETDDIVRICDLRNPDFLIRKMVCKIEVSILFNCNKDIKIYPALKNIDSSKPINKFFLFFNNLLWNKKRESFLIPLFWFMRV